MSPRPIRRLIVNADDLGQSTGINDGVAEAVDVGIVTSASLMVRWPEADAAARWAATRPCVSIGIHLDFGEWAYRADRWIELYRVVDSRNAEAVEAEIENQLGAFVQLVGRPPTHLDSHQHVHLDEPVRQYAVAAACRLGIPLRSVRSPVAYCGSFYGQSGKGEPYPEGITAGALRSILDGIEPGITELGCHPGASGVGDLDSMYQNERSVEGRVLCDPDLRGALAERGIELCSFADVPTNRCGPVEATSAGGGSDLAGAAPRRGGDVGG